VEREVAFVEEFVLVVKKSSAQGRERIRSSRGRKVVGGLITIQPSRR